MRWYPLLLVAVAAPCFAQPLRSETPAQQAARTRWWRDAKFGMFIHWGVYAVPASASGGAEWYLHGSRVQVADYEKFAPRFNPVKFDAAKWVRTAKDAGMKYIVITSKHHDGFAMFDSRLTNWDIVDATPFKRDPLRELADECRKQGIVLGFYYSIMDWHHPDYLPRREWERETRPATGADMNRYIDYMKGQLRELLTRYGRIGVLWFDGGWEHNGQTLRSAEVNALIRSLQPWIVINDRNHLPEDHSTPEQTIPASALPGGRLWETCMTINDTWGYTRDNTNWKSTTDLIRKLCDIAHKGGNFLLNVGPTELGTFPDAVHERLEGMGRWMRINGTSIYATEKSPFRRLAFEGRCTVNGNRLYLHVFKWPDSGLVVEGLKTPIRRAVAFLGQEILPVYRSAEDPARWHIARPRLLDPAATVVELTLAGKPVVDDQSAVHRPDAEGTLHLRAADAEIHGTTAQYEQGPERDNIGFWTNAADYVSWPVQVPAAGTYNVEITYASPAENAGSRFAVQVGVRPGQGEKVEGEVAATGSWGTFSAVGLGTLTLPAGRSTIEVRALSMPRGAVMNLKSLRLTARK